MIDYFNPRSGIMRRKHRPWVWATIEIGWMIAATGMLILLGGAIGAGFGGFAGSFWSMCILLVLVALAIFTRNARRARAMIALNYLDQAVRLNLPIPPMLRAAETAERGTMRRRLVKLRETLESGSPVGRALQYSLPGIPPRIVGLISAGEGLGRLPQALRRSVRHSLQMIDRQPAQAIMLRWYPMIVLMCILPVFSTFVLLVLPKYQALFHDSHIELPAVTRWTIDVWRVAAVPVAIGSIVLLAVFCGRMLSEIVPVRKPLFTPWQGISDRVVWLLPVWRGVVRNREMADFCHVLAGGLEAGQPTDRSLTEAAEVCTNRVLRNRVRRWAEYVTAGVPVADAGRKARMPAMLVGMLATARGTAGTTDVLRFLSSYYDNRFSTAAAVLRGAAIPAMVILLAFFVTILALGVFLPLVQLANHLAVPGGAL